MNFTGIFINRPVATTLVMLGILLFGIFAYRALPVNDLPSVDYPTIQVSAALPGASPETMASSVATPLEKQFSTIAGLDSMSSTSGLGATNITLTFDLNRNIDAAAQDVQTAITQASRFLPAGMPSPPTYNKVNPADSPILYLSLSSPTLPLSEVDEYAETLIGERLSMITGVAQVQVYGAQKYAVRVQLDPNRLAALGVGIDDALAAVQSGNVNLPTGTLYGKYRQYNVQSNGQLMDASAYRNLIVEYKNGAPIWLNEIGRIENSVEDDKIASWYNDTRSVVLAIRRQPGTNTVAVVDSIRKLLPTFKAEMPAAVDLNVLYDRSESIRASVKDVKFTLLLANILVILVIFVFLRKLSSTIIPALALPMSIIGTFTAMYLLGYTLDNLSLMALTLSVGFVVDDAIVMLENIVRHIEMGEEPFEAAMNGAREIGFTIVSMTLSLAAVFIPILFMGGIMGGLLHEFAVTIGVAVLVSGFVSLTLTPMLCSRFLKPHGSERHNALYNATDQAFAGILSIYEKTLAWVLRHRRIAIAAALLMVAGTVYLYEIIPGGFLPDEDNGEVFTFTEAMQGISFDDMVRHQLEVNHIILRDPDVQSIMSIAGAGTSPNTGMIFIHLVPRDKRKLGIYQWIEKMRPEFMKVPGMMVFMQNLPTIRVGGMLTKSAYQYTLQGPDTKTLYAAAQTLEEKIRQLPMVEDVTSDLEIDSPQINVVVNRDKASAYGVSSAQIENALYTAYGSRQVSTIYAPNNEYRVILELLPKYQADPAALSELYIHSTNGSLVPLDAVASITKSLGPVTVNHVGQFPSVTLSFNMKPGHALGEAVDAIEALTPGLLPASIVGSFQGNAQAFQSSSRGLVLLLVMAILVIYIVLGVLYESFLHPITIFSALPPAGLGALFTLWIFHMPLDLYAFVGVIMLVGLVKKNGIMMIDFALEAQRNEHKTPTEAIYEGSLIRFRPIMMTTMAALMGTLPIALGMGAGAESRRPLGMAVVGGLLVSQFLTLYITPVVYTYMESIREWTIRKRRGGNGGTKAAVLLQGEEKDASFTRSTLE